MIWWLGFKYGLTLTFLAGAFTLEAAEPETFTKEEAIEYALENNTEVLNAELETRIAEHQMRETRSTGLPQLDSDFSMDYLADRPVQVFPVGDFPILPPGVDEEDELEVSFGRDYDFTGAATLSQLIFDGEYFVALQASRQFRELKAEELEEQRREVREDVSKAFLRTVQARQSKDILEDNIAQLQETLEETEAMYENGFVEKLDVDRVQLRLNQVRSSHRDAERQHKNALEGLKIQMGYPVEAEIQTEKDLQDYREDEGIQMRPIQEVYQERIEREVMKSREELTALDRRRFQAGYLPTLSGVVRHTRNAQREAFDVLDQDGNWFSSTTFGLTINIPIFDGFRKNAQINQKELELKQLRNQRHLLEESIQAELNEAANNYQSAVEQLEDQRQNRRLAEDIYEQTLERYREGVGESMDVTEAQTDLNEAEMNELSALLDVLVAQMEYEIASGQF